MPDDLDPNDLDPNLASAELSPDESKPSKSILPELKPVDLNPVDETSQKSNSDATTKATGSKSTTGRRNKFASLIAVALWGASVLLSFTIPTNSPLIWLPDTALLLGFFPLLWLCPYSLIWIAFGILTTFIGCFLLLLTNIPNSALPAQSVSIKTHLEIFHPCWSWMLIGLFVTICGSIRGAINLVRLIIRWQKTPR